jgi:hypothetical protein
MLRSSLAALCIVFALTACDDSTSPPTPSETAPPPVATTPNAQAVQVLRVSISDATKRIMPTLTVGGVGTDLARALDDMNTALAVGDDAKAREALGRSRTELARIPRAIGGGDQSLAAELSAITLSLNLTGALLNVAAVSGGFAPTP